MSEASPQALGKNDPGLSEPDHSMDRRRLKKATVKLGWLLLTHHKGGYPSLRLPPETHFVSFARVSPGGLSPVGSPAALCAEFGRGMR